MGKHKHELVYSQEAGDFEKNAWQKKCINCPYKSYVLSVPSLRQPTPQRGKK